MFSYTYLTGKKKKNFSHIQNSIPYSILYSRISSLLRVYHHRPKAIEHKKKHSLKFEIRHLWDADGDPYRLWMPDELYLHRLSATDEKWSDVLI